MPESFSVDVVGVRRLGELFSCVRGEVSHLYNLSRT